MSAVSTYNIKCPCCDTILVIDRATGKVIEHREPLVDNPSDDRFADAMHAQKEHSQKLSSLFEDKLSGLGEKEEERRNLFEESLKQARENDDDEQPIRDIDLD